VRPVRGRVPLLPLHQYPRHRHSTYNACITTCPPARRGGHDVLIRNLCPLLHSYRVFSSLDICLWNRSPHRLCRRLTLRLRLLSTAPFFTNVRLRAGRASPNRSLTKAGVVCPKFPRTPQSVYRAGPRFHQDQENHELIPGSLVTGFRLPTGRAFTSNYYR
jgi:hypothetical protein